MDVAGLSPRRRQLVTSVFPGESDTHLLRAALCQGAAARDAWQRWTETAGDPVRALGKDPRHVKALVPLLFANLRAQGVEVPPALATYARAAHLTETIRMRAYLRECGPVLERLDAEGVQHVVLKGAAFAETLYPEPALRHAHDFDVLVRPEDAHRAAGALIGSGFQSGGPLDEGFHHLAPLTSATGFVVELHHRPAWIFERFDMDGMWRRSLPANVGGAPTRVLCDADALTLVAAHAMSCTTASSLRWAADAWWLTKRLGPADWTVVVSAARSAHVALPLALVLDYLVVRIGAAVPADALAEIAAAAAQSDSAERSAAMFGARRALPMQPGEIVRSALPWPRRIAQLLWRLVPPPRHVRWSYGITRPWMVPLYYPYRWWKLARRAGRGGLAT